jgi:multiple sugar transport system substrate-binding protein
MPGLSRRGFITAGGATIAGVSLMALAGCAPTGAAGTKTGAALTFGTWSGPADVKVYNAFNDQFEKDTGIKVEFQQVVGDYVTKMRTQLVGGHGPDIFGTDDSLMGQATQSKKIASNFSDWASKNSSKIDLSSFYPDLSAFCRASNGDWYGLPQDCNPIVFWYNEDLLKQAGVDKTPSQLQESGDWTMDAATEVLTKLKSTGKTPAAFESQWYYLTSWITTFGGRAFDEKGNAVWDKDPKSLAAIKWIFEQFDNGNMAYAGNLPKGQAVDALFYSGQLATLQYGRWVLPNIQKLNTFKYDMAPLPSESGKDFAPVALLVGGICVNAKSKNVDAASEYLAAFAGPAGQKARIVNGSVCPVVKDPTLAKDVADYPAPGHGKWFNNIVANGYHPVFLSKYPERNIGLPGLIDSLILGKTDYKTFAQKTAAFVNGEG